MLSVRAERRITISSRESARIALVCNCVAPGVRFVKNQGTGSAVLLKKEKMAWKILRKTVVLKETELGYGVGYGIVRMVVRMVWWCVWYGAYSMVVRMVYGV